METCLRSQSTWNLATLPRLVFLPLLCENQGEDMGQVRPLVTKATREGRAVDLAVTEGREEAITAVSPASARVWPK